MIVCGGLDVGEAVAAQPGRAGELAGWVGLWLATFPTVEGLLAQALAAVLVLGSYPLAEYVRVVRPRLHVEATHGS